MAADRLAEQMHCSDVLVLEVEAVSAVTDYFVICTGTSERQMRAVADELEAMAEKMDYPLFGREGYESATWILFDFVDVIVHIFDAEHREYYALEMLWGDAPKVRWRRRKKTSG